MGDLDSVGNVLSVKDMVLSCLPPVGLVFDGIVHGRSPSVLRHRRCTSDGQYEEQGALTVWDGETDVDACPDNLSNALLGKTKEESCPSFWRSAGLSMAGWKR